MSEGMIGLLSLDEIRGVVGDLFLKLVGREGPRYATELRKFVLKQPCWFPETGDPAARTKASASRRLLKWPASGEVFELSIVKPFAGLKMVRYCGYIVQKGWLFTGGEIWEPMTKQFKLVEIGPQPDFKSVQQELTKQGRIPQGQWYKMLTQKFRGAPRRPVGIADASWIDPDESICFPYVWTDGMRNFDHISDYDEGKRIAVDFDDKWLWLVEVR